MIYEIIANSKEDHVNWNALFGMRSLGKSTKETKNQEKGKVSY